jgi:hypothetical protein
MASYFIDMSQKKKKVIPKHPHPPRRGDHLQVLRCTKMEELRHIVINRSILVSNP